MTFMMWVRWTLPRLRIDQVMKTCLKYCTPIAAAMFIGAVLWTYYLPGGLFLESMPYGVVREGQLLEAQTQTAPPTAMREAHSPMTRLTRSEH